MHQVLTCDCENVHVGGQEYYNYHNISKIAKILQGQYMQNFEHLWSNTDINFCCYLSEVDKFGHYFVHNVWNKHNVTFIVGNLIEQVTDLTP